MKKFYVEKSITIDASPSRVWEVLTRPECTREWASAFGAAGPIESSWVLGSPVLWRNAKGVVYVNGNVTEVAPLRLLQFTVRDVFNAYLRSISGVANDEIVQSYSLAAGGAGTVLSTSHGDFGILADGEKLYPLVVQLWERLLPKIKEIAEREPD